MNRLLKKKVIKIIGVMALCLTTLTAFNVPVNAATTADEGIEVIGEAITVSTEDIKNGNEVEVTFNVNTTFSDFKGFVSAVYGIRHNPDKMDLVPGSIKHSGVDMQFPNEDYTVTTMNGVPSQKGDVINGVSAFTPIKSSKITLKFKNLFKDGDRTPIEVQFINRTEDSLTVERNSLPGPFRPANPVIVNAKISLTPIDVSITGLNSLQKGQKTQYTASVKNTLVDNGVNWSITGANDASTSIATDGTLSVAKNETASSVIVTATSKEDGTIKTTKTVSLTNPPQLSVGISGKDQLIKGTKGNVYTSNVVNATNKAVTWLLSGQTSSQTVIDNKGNITVGINETASTLSLKATSVEDPTKSSTSTIKLIDKTYTIKKAELPVSKLEMKAGTTEQQFDVEAQKNKDVKLTIATNDGKEYTITVPTTRYMSDKEVVGEDGVLKEGKFNLIYTMKLPVITVDENGIIQVTEGQTNIQGKDIVSIPVGIGAKVDITVDEDNNTNTGTDIDKKPISKPVKTSDESEMVIYVGGVILAGLVFVSGLIYSRRKNEQ